VNFLCGDPYNFYCDMVTAVCNGTNTIYESRTNCLAESFVFPIDSSANLYTDPPWIDSRDCRIYHVTLAAASTTAGGVALHCGHANASGGEGVCGNACENYCDAMTLYCNGSNVQFSSTQDCMTHCAKYPRNYTGTPMNPITAGDSLECRKYHAILASLYGPTVHCPHAGSKGGGVCSSATRHFSLMWSVLLLPLLWLFASQ